MKRISAVLLTLTLAGASAMAQQKPADTKTAAPATQAQAAAPKVAQAKTKQEYEDYKKAASSPDPAAMEKAAAEFAAKYPGSEMRVMLYRQAMALFQQANEADKTVEMGRQAIAIEPEEPVTLITVAGVLAERTRDTDLDKDDRLKEANEMSEKGLANIEKMQGSPGMSAQQLKNGKDMLRSMALGTLAWSAYVNKNYAVAEKQYKTAIDAYAADPDPSQFLRLTLTLDKEQKYPEALEWANKTLKISPPDSPFVQLANNEIERLKTLTGAAKPAATPAAAPKK